MSATIIGSALAASIIEDALNRAEFKQSSRRFSGEAVTGFGGLDNAARVHRHLCVQLLGAWGEDPTLIVDGSKTSAAETIIDHLGDPAMRVVAVELARLIACAAKGMDVGPQAQLIMSAVAQRHGDVYEAIQVERDNG